MSETDSQPQPEQAPKPLEFEKSDEYSRFMLHAKSEIVFVLRSLIQKGAMITVYFDHGRSFLLTSLLAISSDNAQLIFDLGSDQEMNDRATRAEKLIFTTAVDKVKVQFSLKSLVPAQHEGRPALLGGMPDSVLRLQRREYFRLPTPIAQPVKCLLPMRREDGSTTELEATLADISGGGVGLIAPLDQLPFYENGTIFRDCKIDLPDEGLLVATLCVRNTFQVATKTGALNLRIGCEFHNLPGNRLTMVQRYITRIERERKARLSGMV